MRTKTLLVTLAIASLMLGGCTLAGRAVKKEVEAQLKDKYKEEFIVDSVMNRRESSYNSLSEVPGYKVMAHSKSRPKYKFQVQIDKDYGRMHDDYGVTIMSEQLQELSDNNNAQFFEGNIINFSNCVIGLYDDGDQLNIDPKNNIGHCRVDIVMETENEPDKEEEKQRIKKIAEFYINEKISNFGVTVFFVRPSHFTGIESIYFSHQRNFYDYVEHKPYGTGFGFLTINSDNLDSILDRTNY
ncbi:hypothetical protein [Cohnella mopanensis]|uniref:hypothetical protein n=1 Tax=Cohnella mopanensis TaxID=2911966 RepID=UPI001EF85CF9|nr:hypothetical protein [Cohnella mopanensis]